ncbi:MAG: hypothetical protein LLG02_01625 [Pelosinus sp.]|nr:hypothetical protein [Pelosinus sp.]
MGKAGLIFPKSNSEMLKLFKIDSNTFHKQVKPEILKQIKQDPVYSKEFAKMGKNPDIGVDSLGNIVLKDVRSGEILQTNWSFSSFLP